MAGVEVVAEDVTHVSLVVACFRERVELGQRGLRVQLKPRHPNSLNGTVLVWYRDVLVIGQSLLMLMSSVLGAGWLHGVFRASRTTGFTTRTRSEKTSY